MNIPFDEFAVIIFSKCYIVFELYIKDKGKDRSDNLFPVVGVAILLIDDDEDDTTLFFEATAEYDNNIKYVAAANAREALLYLNNGCQCFA